MKKAHSHWDKYHERIITETGSTMVNPYEKLELICIRCGFIFQSVTITKNENESQGEEETSNQVEEPSGKTTKGAYFYNEKLD